MRVHTYYDNLKVARNAPPEVIRAAYRAMAQKWHPDLNPGSVEAPRVMKLINEAYEQLTDPVKRRAHDVWIETIERESVSQSTFSPNKPSSNGKQYSKSKINSNFVRVWWLLVAFIVFGVFKLFSSFDGSAPSDLTTNTHTYSQQQSSNAPVNWSDYTPVKPEVQQLLEKAAIGSKDQTSAKLIPFTGTLDNVSSEEVNSTVDIALLRHKNNKYVKSTTAPNNKQWPSVASYLEGYPILGPEGLSSLRIDNTQNNNDAHVKLILADESHKTVRQFFIPAYGYFIAEQLSPGSYEIRYRDLENGSITRSDWFVIKQVESAEGIRSTNASIAILNP